MMKNRPRCFPGARGVLGCLVIAVLSILFRHSPALSCSRALWNESGQAVVVGRTMDWPDPMPVNLWSMPRGIVRDGMTGKNTLKWTARYGSVVAADNVASDGMNEKGFAAHMLWLTESEYGKRDENLPGLSVGLWAQYFLDNFATVNEAVEFVKKTPFQIVTAVAPTGEIAALHLVLEDATGDSAVIEYMEGKPVIYHGRVYTVATNSPGFDEQIERLKQYKGFGGEKALPGTTETDDRFVRGAYYLKNLPKPADYRQCVAGVLSVVRNISQPYGVPDDPARPYISATRWRTIGDLTNLVYFFESTTSPNIVWVRLEALDFSKGAPVKMLDLKRNPDRVGDTSKQFRRAKPFVVPAVVGP